MNRQQLLALMILQAAPVFALAATPQPVSLGRRCQIPKLSQYRGARDITFNQQNTEG